MPLEINSSQVFRSAISGVSGAGAEGAALSGQLIGGFRSGTGAAFGAGAALCQTLVGGFLSPLGESGAALTRAAGAITNALGGIVSGLVGGIGQLASLGGKIAGIGAGALLAGIGGAIGLIGGPAGALLGASFGAAIGGFLGKALGAVGELFGNVASAAGEALGKVGELFGQLGSSLVSILGDVAKTVADVGRAVGQLKANGFSAGQAGNLVQTLGFFGQSPSAVAGQFGKPFAGLTMGIRAAAVGLPNPTTDIEGFLLAGARRQSAASRGGMVSAGLFQAQLAGAGFGDYAGTFSQGEDRIRKTLAVSKSFQVGGASLGELSGDVTMANNVLSGLGTQLKLVFAETLLPLLPLISSGFAYIVQNKDAIVGAIKDVGRWLVGELPPMLMRGAAGMLDGLSGLLDGFSGFTAGLAKNLDSILSVGDGFLNGLRTFGATMAGIGAAIAQGAANLGLIPKGSSGGNASGNAAGNAVAPAATPGPSPSGQSAATSGLGQSLGGAWTRILGALSAAGLGAWAGGNAGQALGTAGGAVVGGGLGLGAGGVGAIPGAAAGAGIGGAAGRFLGTLGGALYGAYKGWNAVNDIQTQYGDPMVYGTTGAAGNGAGRAASGGFAPVAGRSMGGGFSGGYDAFMQMFPESNMAGNADFKKNIRDALGSASTFGKDKSELTGGWAKSLREKADAWPDTVKQLESIANNTAKTAEHTDRGASAQLALLTNMPAYLQNMTARVSAYIAEDMALTALHI